MYLGAGSLMAFFAPYAALMAPRSHRDKAMSGHKAIKKTNQSFYHGEEGILLFCRVTVIFLIKNTLFPMSKNTDMLGIWHI